MKSEGWDFVELIGPYEKSESGTKNYSGAFRHFASRVEEIIAKYGEEYVNELVLPQPPAPKSETPN